MEIKFFPQKDLLGLDTLLKKEAGQKFDHYESFLEELFEIRHPHLYKKPHDEEYRLFKEEFLSESPENQGIWIYYPWLKTAYLCPPEKVYYEIFTARNKTLVSEVEQDNYRQFNIGIVGMSIGQSAALTITRSGGSQKIKIADFDLVGPTNLNRLHFGLPQIGLKKVDIVRQRILETNPFQEVQVYDQGLLPENIDDFFSKGFPLNAIIDACDHFPIKLALREKAREYGIPVLMATDVGNAVLLDIERYDLDKSLKHFGGRLEKLKDPSNFLKAAVTVISPEFMPLSVQDAMFEIGKTIPTHPQLGATAYFSGTVLNYALRSLANAQPLSEGRIYIDLDHFFDPRFRDENFLAYKEERTQALKQFIGLDD